MADTETITKIKQKIEVSIKDTVNPRDPVFIQVDLPRRLVLQKAEIDGYLKGLFDCKKITATERHNLSEEFKKEIVKEMYKLRKGV